MLRSTLLIVTVLLLRPGFLLADDAASTGPNSLGVTGGDMTFCDLSDLRQFGRVGDVVGLSVSTTSWNVGTADLSWKRIPQEKHPFIAMNLYRLMDERFEQIGQSWVKHGFYATNSTECGENCAPLETGHAAGEWLGVGCTDTYGAQLNSTQYLLGPRYEINPWTGAWSYAGSHFTQSDTPDAVSHRLQVHDDDLDPALDSGASYFVEGYYVIADDVNVMNSASWKPVTVSGTPGGTWTFNMTGIGTPPATGFAIDAWPGATQTMFAEDNPPIEFVSPDGRSILAGKATDVGGSFWRYDYALLNIDMDRQVGSLRVPVPLGGVVQNVGFHAVQHHDESVNAPGGVSIDNSAWDSAVTSGAVTWSTTSNPVRWGTLYNFHFEVNSPPASDVSVTLGLFKPGTPSQLTEPTLGPSGTDPDCNGNTIPDADEIAADPGLDCDGNMSLDSCELSGADADGDGVLDACDVCPGFDDNMDTDNDGIADGCDPCPLDNPDDSDGDGICESNDPDNDNDGVADADDPQPTNPFICGDADGDLCDDCAVTGGPADAANDGPDNDGDGLCDQGDLDDDNDGIPDALDDDPFNPSAGDPTPQTTPEDKLWPAAGLFALFPGLLLLPLCGIGLMMPLPIVLFCLLSMRFRSRQSRRHRRA